MVASELPKTKPYANTDTEKPHVAFTGLDGLPDTGSHPIKTDTPPKVSEPDNDETAVEGPGDPSKRAVPPTVLFTENGGIREGPAEGKIPDEIPTIVASSTASHTDASAVGAATSTSAGLKEDGTQAQAQPQMLSTPRIKEMVAEGEKPRLSGESDTRPEGTGTKRMFQLSKRFSMSSLPPSHFHSHSFSVRSLSLAVELIMIDAGALSEAWATVEDSDELDNFRPHVVHAPHNPVPIAMCCRKPHGCEFDPDSNS